MIVRRGQAYERFEGNRVYRNQPMALLLAVFAVIVIGSWMGQILSQPAAPGLRAAGIVVMFALGLYVWRAATVRLVVTEDGVTVRNLASTHSYRWADVADIASIPTASTLLGGAAEYVAFRLRSGAVVRAGALRRKPSDARAIAEELDRLRQSCY